MTVEMKGKSSTVKVWQVVVLICGLAVSTSGWLWGMSQKLAEAKLEAISVKVRAIENDQDTNNNLDISQTALISDLLENQAGMNAKIERIPIIESLVIELIRRVGK